MRGTGGREAEYEAELQQTLMDDDCYLPWHVRDVPALTRQARLTASAGDPEPLRNGVDRPVGAVDNAWTGAPGAWVQYAFDAAVPVRERLRRSRSFGPACGGCESLHPLLSLKPKVCAFGFCAFW